MADVPYSLEQDFSGLCTRGAFLKAAVQLDTVLRATKVAAIVGTILILINQIDVILAGDAPPVWKIILTYCVPYSVSTYSAAAFKVGLARKAICGARA